MLFQTLILFVAPVAMAAKPHARSSHKSLGQSKLLDTPDTCDIGEVTCENGCMPPDGVCCNDNTDEYCMAGTYCIPDACCPEGETCDEAGFDDDDWYGDIDGCGSFETSCGDSCIPYDGICCDDEFHYCPYLGTCTKDSEHCCDLYDDGDCSGSALIASVDDMTSWPDDFTSSTSLPSIKTLTDEESTSTARTQSTAASPTTTEGLSADGPITSAPVATVTTTVMEQAGGIFTADGRVAAGIAVVAALLA
ncbi:hypothetical protein GGR52DRAFT_366404 [Hypoxylon sp. FL1284]|nr:hypothetical protein GGR52DRAFT_366404 [Hypoxylon sp. FL1284]